MKCTVCGCENEENTNFCVQCGQNLQAVALPLETVACPHCGKQLRPSAKYCVYCGEKRELPAAEEPAAAQETPAPEEAPICQEPCAVPAEEPAVEEKVPAPVQYHSAPACCAPAYQLPAHRGFWKMLLLGIVTGMLYPVVVMCRISGEINMVASRHDGKRTMHFLWMPVVGALTLGVYCFVWYHKLCGRIGRELRRRQIPYKFGAGSFWLWNFLYMMIGSAVTTGAYFILANMGLHAPVAPLATVALAIVSSVGPCIFVGKLMRAMNLMNTDYNEKG